MSTASAANKVRQGVEVLAIFLFDSVFLLAIFKLSVFTRTVVLPLVYPNFPPEFPFRSFLNIWWIFIVWVFFFYYEGLYSRRFSFWDEVKAIWKVAFFSTAGIFTIVSIGKMGQEISRTTIILMGCYSIALSPSARIVLKKVLRRFGLLKRKVLVLGAGETGRLIVRALRKEPNYGYEVVGFLDDDPAKVGMKIDGIKVHRGVERAYAYVRGCNISDVFIAMPSAGKEKLQGLINGLQHKVERILFVPDMFGVAVLGTNLQHFFHEQAFAFELNNNLSNPLNVFVKKCFDLLVSILLTLFLSAPMLVIAFLIRIDSRGPAMFSQERVGREGMTFRCYKFRTMYGDAEERLAGLLRSAPESREEWERNWKLKEDPRVTRIGRFLRMTSLDELPQLWNVLKGEMSLVGPRPVTQEEIETYYREAAEICFSVWPGITGLWQVSGRSDTGYPYRIGLDLWYVRNWNLWLDIVILFKTVKIVLKREGAY